MSGAAVRALTVLGLLVALTPMACVHSPMPPYAGIRELPAIPQLPPPSTPPGELPRPPDAGVSASSTSKGDSSAVLPPPTLLDGASGGALDLNDVLASVAENFPLLLAVEEERAIASGQRLAAEGVFDLNLRSRGVTQGGTFPNERFDTVLEQALPFGGLSLFGGYRFGFGDFPVYYGDRQTADGGEFRSGIVVPLLRDRPIDRRRALLRQAQIQESLADPIIQRARIDYFRNGARTYWNWVAAGSQCEIADALLRIAKERQAGLEELFRRGQIAEFNVIDNRRMIAEREGAVISADRRFQQTAFELSLFLRDGDGDPIVPQAHQLPRAFDALEPTKPFVDGLANDVVLAIETRPELSRFALLKERFAVELRWALNQTAPALNAVVAGAQDVGKGKDSTGIFALDRSNIEASLLLEVPLQRRDASGRVRTAQAQLRQLLAQERFARDQITAEVQDAVSNLEQSYLRLGRAREEQRVAQRVAELERERFEKGQGTLLEVNLRELSAAGAQIKVIDALADYLRATADYRASLGLDGVPPSQLR